MGNRLIILFLFFIVSCENNSLRNKETEDLVINDTSIIRVVEYIPDICLNEFTLMEKIESFGDEKLINDYLFCKSKNENEFLAMAANYGDIKNEYRLFRVFRKEQFKTYSEFRNINIETIYFKQLDDKNFISESYIKLGLDKSDLIAKKGSDYLMEEIDGYMRITYKIIDYEKSDLLQKYSMPEYRSEYLFDKNNKLIQFNFGFIMP